VLDESDRLLDDLDYNFGEQLSTIFAALPANRQTLLFSATLTEKLQEVSELALKKPYFWASKDSYVVSVQSCHSSQNVLHLCRVGRGGITLTEHPSVCLFTCLFVTKLVSMMF